MMTSRTEIAFLRSVAVMSFISVDVPARRILSNSDRPLPPGGMVMRKRKEVAEKLRKEKKTSKGGAVS